MARLGGNKVPSITQAEHIGPDDTGDNISAKKVANYTWNGSSWERLGATGLVPKVYDTIQITSYNGNDDPLIVVYKTGGTSGTTVATLTMTYSGTNITSVVRT